MTYIFIYVYAYIYIYIYICILVYMCVYKYMYIYLLCQDGIPMLTVGSKEIMYVCMCVIIHISIFY
jgi:hypothetical protein